MTGTLFVSASFTKPVVSDTHWDEIDRQRNGTEERRKCRRFISVWLTAIFGFMSTTHIVICIQPARKNQLLVPVLS